MDEFPKIHIDDLHVSLRPEELDSILGLRNTFDYFEVLGNYLSSYLEIGWVVKLVIPHLDITLDVDFGQVREVWNQGLTDLAIKGVHTCLMVNTGPASNLMVMEVHGRTAEKALAFGRDWRSRCLIQLEEEREQHFFTWPQAMKIPGNTVLESLDVQIFGEGGRVTVPPSLVPGVKDPIRWIVPPWESPPAPVAPRLMEFLEGNFPKADYKVQETKLELPAWEEIFANIASQAHLMQTLLTPVIDVEGYYRNLVHEAKVSGLQDQRLLLGLLWHAPLGTKRHDRNSLQWFKDLITENKQSEGVDSSQLQEHMGDLIKELSRTLTDLTKERENFQTEIFNTPKAVTTRTDHASLGNQSGLLYPKHITPEPGMEFSLPESPDACGARKRSTVCPIHPSNHTPEELPVNRKHYEAMIYELGRLGALQKVNKRFAREADSLKAKIEAERQKELDHLRQLVHEKKNKGWW